MSKMSDFFPMKRSDFWFLIGIVAFAFISFLPWSRRIIISGMALFGWMMAIWMAWLALRNRSVSLA